MKRILLLSIFSFSIAAISITNASGQDIHFSQFNETPMHLNPAYTGMFDGVFRVTCNYRNQWASMGHPYTTAAAAFDMPILPASNRAYLGAGAFLYHDQAGDSKFGTFQALLAASAIVPMNDYNKISAGFMGGFSQRSATTTSLTWENQYVNGAFDPNASSNEANLLTSFPYADLSAGMAYQYRNVGGNIAGKDVIEVDAGGAVFHFNRPEQKFHGGGEEKLDMRYVAHVQMRFDIPDSKFSVRPSAYYMTQGPAHEFVFGGLLRYRIKNGTKITNFFSESGIGFGVHYRWNDAILPQLYYDLGDFFIGTSYDFNISKYSAVSHHNGGFEVTLRYANLNGALYKNRK
ncbi:MAG TPA: PorP/SprF family type IX secretion system membrane protein [Bacteroidia bacterium]|jgi:type IX secretion system PorP/SprF family membrane protein|nr:PorP/SprF family type IX secretion system membrane protein [Bacteroidia bacterium]